MKPRVKLLRWLAIAAGGLLVLFALFLVEERIRGRIELNRYMMLMRAKGERFTIEELMQPPVPPDENGARILMGAFFPQSELIGDRVPASLRFITPGIAIPAARIHEWVVSGQSEMWPTTNLSLWAVSANAPVPQPNAPVARRRGRGGVGGRSTAKSWATITAKDVANELAASSNSLAQVRAALAYPQLDHQLDYSAGFNILVPHLAREKTAAQWLRVASFSALQVTNLNGSLENLLALAALSHATTNETLMISQLVRFAITQIMVGAVWEGLQVDGWSEKQLAELQAALAPADFVTAIGRAFEMERLIGPMMIDHWAKDLSKLDAGLDSIFFSFPPINVEQTVESFRDLAKSIQSAFKRFVYEPVWKVAWKDQDKLNLMKYWQAQIDSARLQGRHQHWAKNQFRPATASQEFFPSEHGGSQSYYDRARYLCSSLMVGSAGRSLRRAVECEVAQALAATAIALHRYRLTHGNYPDSLSSLAPGFLPAIPIDPFDGQSIRYRRNESGSFALYSVGENGTDDGGDASPSREMLRPQFLNGRDVVWPRAATTEEIRQFTEVAAERYRSSTVP